MQRYPLLAGAVALGLTVAGFDSSVAEPDCFCKSALVTSTAITPGVPPVYWAGFYLGGNIGGDWGEIAGPGYRDLYYAGFPLNFQGADLSGGGVLGGLQAGYNWQSSCCFIFGVEVDIGGMDAGLNSRAVTVQGAGGDYVSFRTDSGAGFFGDVTARAGYSWGHTLVYAKGGFAWFDPGLSVTETIITASGTTVYGNADRNSFLTGWTAGGGFETMINPRWSWKIEYQYFDFANDNNDNGCCFDGVRNFRYLNGDLTINSVKVGFNYIFNYARPILK
jgi:outer membrane immunogenic protein